jgi:hypothetical protein
MTVGSDQKRDGKGDASGKPAVIPTPVPPKQYGPAGEKSWGRVVK